MYQNLHIQFLYYYSWYDETFFTLWMVLIHTYVLNFIRQLLKWHGRLAWWRKWKSCEVGVAKEGLENELWRRWSNGRVGEWVVTLGKAREGLENDLWRRWSDGKLGESEWAVTSPTSQLGLILQAFRHFTYVTAHSPTLPSLYLMSQLILKPFHCFTYIIS